MVYVNEGIEEIQKGAIRGIEFELPTYFFFAGAGNTVTGSEDYASISNEYIRKEVTWVKNGINSQFTVQLSPVDAIGENIEFQGLITSPSAANDKLFTIDESTIGLKNEAYSSSIVGEIVIRRPIV